jgi:orotidine-5'-phosphate decarboxylase
MGEDSVKPFLEYKNKWTIVLGLTSNTGAKDFELKKMLVQNELLYEGMHTTKQQTKFLYETVLETVSTWGNEDNLMFVVGATQPDEFLNIRKFTPNHFYLVPGVGAQGGSLKEISEKAMIKDCGLLVNMSRAIIYASNGEDFADAAARVAKEYADEMKDYLSA